MVNAEAVEPGGRVSLRASAARSHLAVRISNSGQHIPPEAIEHLFEPYSPEGEPIPGRGYGLGLWEPVPH